MHKRSAILAGIAFLVMGIAVGYIVVSHRLASPAVSPTPSPTAVQYRNTTYGLAVALPASWQGYSVTTIMWNGQIYDAKGNQTATDHGPQIILSYPGASDTNPHEALPIMVFTPSQWALVSAGDTNPAQPFMAVGAAPFGPSLLARNSQYVFALPARYNYDYKPGWEEVQAIIDAKSISAFEPVANTSSWETYSNTRLGFEVQIPPSWKGYSVTEEGNSTVWFSLPTTSLYVPQRNWLAITRYTIAGWQTYLKEEGPKSTLLAQNDLYVYAYGTAQDYNPDMAVAVNDTQKLLATFKITQ